MVPPHLEWLHRDARLLHVVRGPQGPADRRSRAPRASRVVTLVGPGGVGKTRVALRFAEEARRTYRDGCWVVPLADLADPELLSATVAEALDLQATDRPWQVETLADHIADRTALLVLDNCEHLLPAVGDLVRDCARAVRPPLPADQPATAAAQRRGRHRWSHRSASPRTTVAAPEAITHYEAVDLFVDRATSARSDFQLTPDNAEAVVTLCRDAGRRPAGPRARCRQDQGAVAAGDLRQPDRRLEVLNLGYRDAEDRHQSLRACVEWSYDLCTQLEQRFWARSSVFVGGYDLRPQPRSAVAATCPPGRSSTLMSGLVDQSVVLAEEAAPGYTRYRMLADIRQFGLERAEKAGELHGVQQRHAIWCAELVSRFDDDACGPHQPAWLRGYAWSTRT